MYMDVGRYVINNGNNGGKLLTASSVTGAGEAFQTTEAFSLTCTYTEQPDSKTPKLPKKKSRKCGDSHAQLSKGYRFYLSQY